MNKLTSCMFVAPCCSPSARSPQPRRRTLRRRQPGCDGARREHVGALRGGRRAAGTAATPASAARAPKPAPAAANKPPRPNRTAKDRLDLDSSQITGNRELPKVLYIVPWRSAELGDLVGRPVNSLLDEVLEPVDRDVFRRQNRYFEALQPNEAAPASNTGK